jgi:hypothetical protein
MFQTTNHIYICVCDYLFISAIFGTSLGTRVSLNLYTLGDGELTDEILWIVLVISREFIGIQVRLI